MNKRQTGQESNQNPTLQEVGTSVPDYGNVMGGASDENVKQDQQDAGQENKGRSGNNETLGNP